MFLKHWWARILTSLVVLGFILAVFLGMLRGRGRADIAPSNIDRSLVVESASFSNGGAMSKKHTCEGANLSPEIHWPSPPPAAKSLAILMEDRDAPFGFVHWVVYNIPPGAGVLTEGASSQEGLPAGATEGMNSADTVHYSGPCPPGTKPHRYIFRFYALDLAPTLPPGKTKQALAATVKGHVLAEGRTMGLYGRENK